MKCKINYKKDFKDYIISLFSEKYQTIVMSKRAAKHCPEISDQKVQQRIGLTTSVLRCRAVRLFIYFWQACFYLAHKAVKWNKVCK